MRTITLNDGKERQIYFDYNVASDVQDRFGDVTLLTEKMKSLKETKWIVFEVINEAIAKKNHDIGTSDPTLTEFEVGLIMPLTKDKIQNVVGAVIAAFNDCVGVGKNAIAGDLTTQASSTQEPTRATE